MWWQDSVCETFHASLLFSCLSLYFLECSGVFFAYSSTAKSTNHAVVFIACFTNSFNFLFRYKEKSTIYAHLFSQFQICLLNKGRRGRHTISYTHFGWLNWLGCSVFTRSLITKQLCSYLCMCVWCAFAM